MFSMKLFRGMTRVLLVTHPYHARTRSPSFFVEALTEIGCCVQAVTSDSVTMEDVSKSEVVVAWQNTDVAVLARELQKRLIFVPMLDQVLDTPSSELLDVFQDDTVICYSSNLHGFLTLLGANCHYIQYWPKAKRRRPKRSEAIFWERTPSNYLTFADVARYIDQTVDRFTVRTLPDPFHNTSEVQGHITSSQVLVVQKDWLPAEEYQETLARALIFVAPRFAEGIGLSFLEAMANGCVVVARDFPTMNEYIEHGKTGILTSDWTKPALDAVDFAHLGRSARRAVAKGARKYKRASRRFYKGILQGSARLRREDSLVTPDLTLAAWIRQQSSARSNS